MCYRSKWMREKKREKMERLFYNNSSASCLHWFISRNNTLHLFLVPYPFKIEASLQNSLSLQCTYLCIFDISQCTNFLECWPGSPVKLSSCNNAACEGDYWATDINKVYEHFNQPSLKEVLFQHLHISYFSTKNNYYAVKHRFFNCETEGI